ncbi:hypothetical protein BLX88_02305 [Bacillus obstructivus]|uniref:EAL and HDOD domain-containing protein n=1 Tax=Heyndrickxia oleronia TaxID=38875 RepID=UPI00090404D3|nr:hypothetical protein BLX88_02305 [Bacillus obstructivus]
MEVFVARQPIFNIDNRVVSYELLYRNDNVNSFPNIDGDQATADVIINSFFNIGIDNLSSGLPCFINFTENLLKHKVPTYFSPRDIVIEILENVTPSRELVEICRELKKLGYKIALDDYIFYSNNLYSLELLKFVDIVKIDFMNTNKIERKEIEKIIQSFNIKLLAEKVETKEQFEEAKQNGYTYFQGYYFSQPVIISTFDIPASFRSYLQIVRLLSNEDVSIEHISMIIEQDLSLAYKLLKLINSPAHRPTQKIHSIHQAIILLGLIEIKRWIFILAIRENAGWRQQLSEEVCRTSLTRAKFCELISEKQFGKSESPKFFLLGLFSLLDAILFKPMDEVLNQLSLEESLFNALCGEENSMRKVLDLSIALEKAEWEKMDELLQITDLTEQELSRFYQQAWEWSDQVMNEDFTYISLD